MANFSALGLPVGDATTSPASPCHTLLILNVHTACDVIIARNNHTFLTLRPIFKTAEFEMPQEILKISWS